MKDFLKNIARMVAIMSYFIGTIAGIGNSIMIGEYVTAVAIIILAIMAFPVTYYLAISIGK